MNWLVVEGDTALEPWSRAMAIVVINMKSSKGSVQDLGDEAQKCIPKSMLLLKWCCLPIN